jgi:hypothetical protein
MKRLSAIRILLAVQILVGLKSRVLGIPKLTGLLVGKSSPGFGRSPPCGRCVDAMIVSLLRVFELRGLRT